ncbi:MAG: hypothetical protein PHG31_01185 [Candidatus Omnitrophica bacterium]|nr:hypothetical protein [Candidatus Omnitrophota bacterium]
MRTFLAFLSAWLALYPILSLAAEYQDIIEVDGIVIENPTRPSMDDVEGWIALATETNDEMVKACLGQESDLLSTVQELITFEAIIRKAYQGDMKGSLMTSLDWLETKALDNITSYGKFVFWYYFPKTYDFLGNLVAEAKGFAGPFTTAFKVYNMTLQIIHKFIWIPTLEDNIYKAYKNNRDTGDDPWEAYNLIIYLLEPVRAEVKSQLLEKRYNIQKGGFKLPNIFSTSDRSSFSQKDLTDRFRQRINVEVDRFLIAMLENHYIKDKMPEMLRRANEVAQEQQRKAIERAKDKLKIDVKGIVTEVVKDKDGRESERPVFFAKVAIEGKNHAVHSDANGHYVLPVPYRLVNGDRFYVYAEKGKEGGSVCSRVFSKEIVWNYGASQAVNFQLSCSCRPVWNCAGWYPDCDGQISDRPQTGERIKSFEVTRHCGDYNSCRATYDDYPVNERPPKNAYCVKKEKPSKEEIDKLTSSVFKSVLSKSNTQGRAQTRNAPVPQQPKGLYDNCCGYEFTDQGLRCIDCATVQTQWNTQMQNVTKRSAFDGDVKKRNINRSLDKQN